MNRNQTLGVLLLLSLILGIAYTVYYHSKLPERVAIHFNAQGKADGFASRNAHTALMIGLQTGMAAFMAGLGWLMRSMPANLINVPHREFWFAPERRLESAEKVRGGLLIIAIGTQWFLMSLNHLTTRYNLGLPGMDWFWVLLVLYLVFIFGFCVWFSRQFQLPENLTGDKDRLEDPSEPF